MQDGNSLSGQVAAAWDGFDFPRCLGLLQETLRRHEESLRQGDTGASPLWQVADVLAGLPPQFDCVVKEHHDTAHACLDAYAEILRVAAGLNPLYSVAALRGLIERGRAAEGLALVPIAQRHPDFIAVASLVCTALYGAGQKEEALALFRDRLRQADCPYFYVTELVKIGRLTGYAESEFAALDRKIQTGYRPASGELAYYAQLGVALQRQSLVAERVEKLSAQPELSVAARLATVELHIDALNLEAAFALLQMPLGADDPKEWHHALQRRLEQLVAAHLGSHEWQKARAVAAAGRPKVVLTLSGFVRSYEGLASLFAFLRRHVERWDIDIFAQSFDRLGNLYMRTQNLGHVFYDYGHGGFYREIMKTPPLRIETLYKLLSPVRLQVEPRQPDDHYVKSIGLAHPQWLAVWEAWQLFERHRALTGDVYRFAIRGRYDKDYDQIDLDRLDLRDNQIATPANDFYGRIPYTINDQFAVGSVDAMAAYCRIGDGRNFKHLENTPAWDEDCAGAEGSHETHLALWLHQHHIDIVRPDWLRLAY